jgi:toxin CcdB
MPGSRPGYVVDIQSRLLGDLATRVVIPVIPKASAPRITLSTLNPIVTIGGAEFVLMTQNVAAVPLQRLGAPAGSLDFHRDDIVRAIDALLSGL